jgi:ESCRT-II complex subunit VPS36
MFLKVIISIVFTFAHSSPSMDWLFIINTYEGRKAWEATSRQQLLKPVSKDTAKKVGVDAILSKNKEWHEGAKRISEDAFSRDVEGLMTEARDLVLVINKYVATLENKKKLEGSNNGQVVVINEEEERLSEMLSHMGMMSAITKKSSGSLYHQQLARQLADFLIQSNIVIKQGGMITLADVYCLFNRARGTNLITPGTYDIFALCIIF